MIRQLVPNYFHSTALQIHSTFTKGKIHKKLPQTIMHTALAIIGLIVYTKYNVDTKTALVLGSLISGRATSLATGTMLTRTGTVALVSALAEGMLKKAIMPAAMLVGAWKLFNDSPYRSFTHFGLVDSYLSRSEWEPNYKRI